MRELLGMSGLLRREQREWLESKHCEKPSHRQEGEAKHRRRKHSPQTRRNGSTPVGYSGQIDLRA
jgi:Spy/CpxP family protein refolding chaperone